MHAEIIDTSNESMILMSISHRFSGNDMTIRFPCSSSILKRNSNKSREDLFKYINLYWAAMSREVQDHVFSIYLSIEQGQDTLHSNVERTEFMRTKMAELYSYHELSRMREFLSFETDMRIPDDVPAVFVMDQDFNHTEDKTYLRHQYADLAALSTVFKTFIPIWGNYINGIRKNIGNDFKEHEAFLLLTATPLIESEPILKLKTYVEHSSGVKGLSNPENIYKGITSEDCSFWLTARTCIRRVVSFDISGEEHLIKILNSAVKQFARDQTGTGSINVKKIGDTEGSGGEDSSSTIEGVRCKSNISIGAKVELQYAVRDIRTLTQAVMFSLDPRLLENAIATATVLEGVIPAKPQLTLMKWVMCQPDVLSYEAPDYLGTYHTARLLAATQAILWQAGHHNLAMLATATAVVNDNEFMTSVISTKAQVAPVEIEKVTAFYPFDREPPKRKAAPPAPDIVQSIEALAKDFSNYRWRATASDELLLQAYGNQSRTIVLQPDLKNQLTSLVYDIGAKSWI